MSEKQRIEIPVEGGKLIACLNVDTLYPGIFIDFVRDGSDIEEPVALIEKKSSDVNGEENPIRTLAWKKREEDYDTETKWGKLND